jgi:hypothetical protein
MATEPEIAQGRSPVGGDPAYRPRLCRWAILAVAGLVGTTLAGLSGRYGYHRDELYFLACGRHLAWGYPDQPPFVPLLARLMSEISSSSVMVLRIPAELAAAATVYMTGVVAREFGAGRIGQLLAAGSIGVSSILLSTGHVLNTSSFLPPFWIALTLVAIRAVRTGNGRWWLAFGAIAGVGQLDSDLIALYAGSIAAGVLIVGPRRSLLTPWALLAVGIDAAIWSPYLLWQSEHGWPQLTVAHSIATGGSGTSAPRWQVVVLQLVLCSPLLVPLWVAGLVRLLKRTDLQRFRALGVAYVIVLAAVLISGGKPYYLAGTFPLLIASGARPLERWAAGRSLSSRGGLIAVFVISAIADALITLPVVPEGVVHDTPIVAMDYDVGETIAWPRLVREIATVYDQVPMAERSQTVILTRNYGEAGAVDRFGAELGLPRAYSGHNAYWLWGPPPPGATTVVAIGIQPALLRRLFRTVVPEGRLDNDVGVNNDEQHIHLWICSGLTQSWSHAWPALQRYG